MLGGNNGVAALFRRDISYVVEQHCVVHREALGIDDACKHVSLMQDVDTSLRTVHTLFCKSSVKKIAFKEQVEVLESESLAFKLLMKYSGFPDSSQCKRL